MLSLKVFPTNKSSRQFKSREKCKKKKEKKNLKKGKQKFSSCFSNISDEESQEIRRYIVHTLQSLYSQSYLLCMDVIIVYLYRGKSFMIKRFEGFEVIKNHNLNILSPTNVTTQQGTTYKPTPCITSMINVNFFTSIIYQ